MACTPTHCQDHGTGTTTCVNHRATCAANRILSWGDAVQGGTIYASQIEELRSKLVAEIDTYNAHANYNYAKYGVVTSGVSSGQVITNEVFNGIRDTESQITGVTGVNYDGELIEDSEWDNLISAYSIIRTNCICNSDCSCNNVCVCHGDCGCNYSDERLKTDITFEGVVNGLKIYTWKYIWNTAKTFRGVIAQDLIGTKHAHALVKDNNGYYMVNYSKLPDIA